MVYVHNTCIIRIEYRKRKKVAKVSEIVKIIKKTGCYKIREGGNHEIWFCPATGEEIPIPRHYGRELPTGTANNILQKAGLK